MGTVIDVQHLSKSFGSREVLKDIDFSVKKGEVVCIIGSSGSGKSTFFAVSIFWKNQAAVKSFIMVKIYRMISMM